ncbi:tail fiber assembly protein [Pantoea sp. SOD02]|uniref:tail fiber assembly protein n=1 Tax=Pantoea sp. SOD02 TaxID=2970818 RepID=UPI002158316A|nr:tail fiber assembly protein [Pantoea sp. SOD02]UVC28817.1 tail fiber assembly protein [Pantoea sp. SOD02]
MKKYSANSNAFYDSEINTAIPVDAITITDEEWMDLLNGQSAGRLITPDMDGKPILIERVLTDEEKLAQLDAMKLDLRAVADKAIAPLQDAASLGIATDDESASLKAWMTYRVLLNRVDTNSGEVLKIIWPKQPV